MNTQTLEPETTALRETTGTVSHVNAQSYKVETDNGVCQARRAVSCLVQPLVGDRVLIHEATAGQVYILAILERDSFETTQLAFEGDVAIAVANGKLGFAANEGIDLISRATVSVASDKVEVRVRESSVFLSSIRLIAGTLDSTFDRISQRVKRVYRRVTELEQLRAGQIDYKSEGGARLHGENTVITANELIKADGKQIHIG